VGLDYHVAVLGHAYSVPHTHAKARVEIRITPHLIEIFRDQGMIAVHPRVLEPSSSLVGHTTLKAHMLPSHRQWSHHSAEHVLTQPEGVGEATGQLIKALMKGEQHPEQELRSAQGVLQLSKAYGVERLEAACRRAVFLHAYSVQSVQSILQHRLDEAALPSADLPLRVAEHANVRGPAYYQRHDGQTADDGPEVEFDPTLN